ncbi:MAG: LysM peptidoglycan-binding domain-containing protein [Flavobacteriaceae bacterium]|nr:LysM peptidoglycan-binding domain-containing protein [Flavobacteriaceae bacterium]
MRYFFPFFLFFFQLLAIAQTDFHESQNDTINSNTEVNSIENEFLLSNVNPNEGVNLLTSEITQNDQSKIVEVPVFDLQDDPKLSALDAKWMDLVRFYDQFDASALFVENLPSENIVVEELSTELLKKRLAALDAKTPFNIVYNQELENLIKSYIKNRPKAISNLMAKSKYYFPLFEEKLDLYDVPIEVKYLAIIESALQPKARSKVGATGLWQFMLATGKQYGLDVTSYIDERQDPILSSEAAAKHLSDLYDIFEDWDLALAAYNSGAGNVNKAIRRAGGKKNYWNIRPYLPRETANYVPIFYATMYMFEYGESHNIIPDKNFKLQYYEVDTIQVKRNISFEQIKTTTGIDISLLEFLNPTYKLNIIPYEEGKNYYLTLPKEYVGLFVQNENLIYAYVDAEAAKREKPMTENVVVTTSDTESKAITYRVKSGDYLGKIADKHNVTVKNIMKWNHLKSTKVHVGQKLKIYKKGSEPTTEKSAVVNNTKSTTESSSKKTTITYTVKSGDNLLKISKKYTNVTVEDIKKWNNLKSDKINVGAKLKIYKS